MLCLLDRTSDGFSRLGPIPGECRPLGGISPGTKAKPPVVVWPTALLCGPLLTVFLNRKAPGILYAETRGPRRWEAAAVLTTHFRVSCM
jgi:hypothetical protein